LKSCGALIKSEHAPQVLSKLLKMSAVSMPIARKRPAVAVAEPTPVEPAVTVNRGTGAGGANTNLFGKKFEEKTNNEDRLIADGFTKNWPAAIKKPKKHEVYLSKTLPDRTIYFVLQTGLKTFMKNKYDVELFRCPDEAYIIEYKSGRKVIKILEKKEQNVEGSVETKLWAGPALKREYELMLMETGAAWEVHYGFCVSSFLKDKMTSGDKKYTALNTILSESSIDVLFGDDEDYFAKFDAWLSSGL
jgi:hypothetical protein